MSSNQDKFKEKLSKEQYKIMRERCTEAPFSGKLLHNKADGVYRCAACGGELFSSEHKFDSGTGWPSFYDVARSESVKLESDNSLGQQRIEAVCANCGSHLGHVFDDAPDQPTGKRYCINSVCLEFEPQPKK